MQFLGGTQNAESHTEDVYKRQEAYRPEKGFSDALKGFVLYQAKIVRPKELVVLNCKAGA